VKLRLRRTPAGRDLQWLLTLAPAFPLLLLVLRLWYLSRQNLETMLLLVQFVSPLGLLSALLITLVWVPPLAILPIRALGALLWLSAPSRPEALRSWLVRLSVRMPDWVVVLTVLLAALTWQLRFLPTLLMLALSILGLAVRDRHPEHRRLVRGVCVVLPLVAAAAAYTWLLPAGAAAARSGETVTAALLLVPPALTVLLTGPVPAGAARLVTHWVAVVAALLAPFAIGAIFLRAPILPTVALEVGDPAAPAVVRAHVIAVDDRMTTLLDTRGRVLFVPNADVLSQALCPGATDAPASEVLVRGWHVELSALQWLAPAPPPVPADPRCQGRPLRSR
jgi:hypothetical protein